jgi:hypothetical protein
VIAGSLDADFYFDDDTLMLLIKTCNDCGGASSVCQIKPKFGFELQIMVDSVGKIFAVSYRQLLNSASGMLVRKNRVFVSSDVSHVPSIGNWVITHALTAGYPGCRKDKLVAELHDLAG